MPDYTVNIWSLSVYHKIETTISIYVICFVYPWWQGNSDLSFTRVVIEHSTFLTKVHCMMVAVVCWFQVVCFVGGPAIISNAVCGVYYIEWQQLILATSAGLIIKYQYTSSQYSKLHTLPSTKHTYSPSAHSFFPTFQMWQSKTASLEVMETMFNGRKILS